MKTNQEIHVRVFPVHIRDERTGETMTDEIAITKEQLQAAQIVGESSHELIYRAYNRAGFYVLDIGKAVKATITIDLMVAYRARGEAD